MLVHMWDRNIEGTLCGREIGRAGMTVERQHATCEACVTMHDNENGINGGQHALLNLKLKTTTLKREADVLQVRLDNIQPSRDQLEPVLRLIQEL